MPHEFTSLRYPLLRLQEAEYFLGVDLSRFRAAPGTRFGMIEDELLGWFAKEQ